MRTLAPSLSTDVPLAQSALSFLRLLLPVYFAIRIVYAAKLLLAPDESFYWLLSRHLATGYFDHPPMIAYLIALGTRIGGSTELGVRVLPVLMAVGCLGIIIALARRIFEGPRSAVWVALIWLTSPLLAALGTIATPDTPATFFSVCALAMAALIAHRDDTEATQPRSSTPSARLWMLFGLFSGLAMVSKYTGVLLPTAVALAMLFSARGRTHYRRPWIYLSGIIALVVFSPVIWWNYHHHWASFLFQLRHGTTGAEEPGAHLSAAGVLVRFLRDGGIYLGEQFLVWTPALFVLAVAVLGEYWLREFLSTPFSRPARRAIPLRANILDHLAQKPPLTQLERVLLWSGTIPLLLFGLANFRAHHTEANWPAFAYFPISLLTVRWLSQKWDGRRIQWMKAGIRVALVGFIGMHVMGAPPVTKALLRMPYRFPHAVQDLVGWPQFGRWLGELSRSTGAPIVTNRHQDAGEASFYIPGQPDVWCVSAGSRPTAFDYFDEQPDFAMMPQILWVGGHAELFCKTHGYIEVQRFNLMLYQGQNSRPFVALLLTRQQR